MARLPRLFRIRSRVPKNIAADTIVFRIIVSGFLFYIDKVCCVSSLESPRRGDSNENRQHTFMSEKLKEISLLCLLTRLYN